MSDKHLDTTLTFGVLRHANVARLPVFKNKHGQPAHAQPDGSDWSPAQWLQATLGELGEFALVREEFEAGRLSRADYEREAAKEMADFATYTDILALRALDEVQSGPPDAPQILMRLIAQLGIYANAAKKLDRGDLTDEEFGRIRADAIGCASSLLMGLSSGDPRGRTKVVVADPAGVDLGQAVKDKFNEVSDRVGAPVHIVTLRDCCGGHCDSDGVSVGDSGATA